MPNKDKLWSNPAVNGYLSGQGKWEWAARGEIKATTKHDGHHYLNSWLIPFTLKYLTLVLLNPDTNSVDPDQLASEEANWSGSALFVIEYENLYQQSGSSNLIGWKSEVGMAS